MRSSAKAATGRLVARAHRQASDAVDVRLYHPDDMAAVTAFLDAAEIEPRIAEELREGNVKYSLWVAWDTDRVVGVLEGDTHKWMHGCPWPVDGWQGWICHIAVSLKDRGRGIGSALIASFREDCRSRGLDYIGLAVHVVGDVVGRIRFFERCGFHRLEGDDPPVMLADLGRL